MSVALAVVLTLAVALAISAGLTFVVRRASRDRDYILTGDGGSPAVRALTSIYALSVAFVLGLTLQSYLDAKRAANTEAAAVVSMSREAVAFHPTLRDPIEHELICYARSVIDDEWPQLADGRSSSAATADIDRIANDVARLEQRGVVQQAAAAATMNDLASLQDARQARLRAGGFRLPSLLWIYLVAAGVLLLVMLAMILRRERRWLHFYAIASIAIVLIGGMLVLRLLERPFEYGVIAIEPTSMRAALDSVQRFAPAPNADRPCP